MQPLTDDPRGSAMRRADPAPSRLAYRVQRWMLTPGVRLLLRVGLPCALVLGAVTSYMADETRRDSVDTAITSLRQSIEERPEFMVNAMTIDGAGPSVAQDIREVVPIDFPVSSFDLDLEVIRATIAGLNPVREARVRIKPGGILQVDVVERLPALVWRTRDGIELVDEKGVHVGFGEARTDYPDLPLIAGDAAAAHVEEALRLFAAAAPLKDRLRGLVRVGDRRWDVVLDRDQRILLPETRAVQALERVIALDQAYDMLARDVAVVDMRLSDRPTLRMTEAAVGDWRQLRQINGLAGN